MLRTLVLMAAFAAFAALVASASHAAPDCAQTEARKPGDQIVDWYDLYIRPWRTVSAPATVNKAQVEALTEEMGALHRRAVLDPLYFEPLAQQILARYADASSFRGIDAAAAGKIYKPGAGARLDFSLLCIDAKTVRTPEDSFAITLFGVTADDCQHVGLRGLVFTDTWVNGSVNGQCRPDQVYYRMWVLPVPAGLNSITFICRKEQGGCTPSYDDVTQGQLMAAQTMFDRIWDRHVVAEEDGELLLYVDRALIHEGSSHSFAALAARRRKVFRPRQVFAFNDHYVPTTGRDKGVAGIAQPEIRDMVLKLAANSAEHGITLFGIDDPRQGILHIVPPELGITQPGLLIVGADSHTSTHGAFGCFAFGVGASEVMHVMTTQTIWQRKPKAMRIAIDGVRGPGVAAKDVILAIIARIGAGGATGHVIEYAGSAIAAMSMEERMTVCNMSIEAGGRAGMVAPDATTFAYMANRPYAPSGKAWDEALAAWQALPGDAGAKFDKVVKIDAAQLAPMVTWGTSPEHALPITGRVPDPRNARDATASADISAALDYMALTPGTQLDEIAVDRVFIGSCTNARIEDLRAAAEVAKLGRAKVATWVVPGSRTVQRMAEQEGLDDVFRAAGFEWRDPGCSLCTAINGDQLRPGERCASTSNRNFKGRQGTGGRTHLVSPAMAAAAALTGRLTDVRELLKGR